MQSKMNFEEVIRSKAIEIHKGECGNKAGDINFWVGSPYNSEISTSIKKKCSKCGGGCWIDTKMMKYFRIKKPIYICGICCLKSHKNKLTALQLEILKKAYGEK